MAAEKTVTVVSPDGAEVEVSSAATVNSLIFGQGYKLKGGGSVDAATAKLNPGPVVTAEPVKPAPAAKKEGG